MGLFDKLASFADSVNQEFDRQQQQGVSALAAEGAEANVCELYMKQAITILGDKYSIYDVNKQEVYNIKGSITGLNFNITRADGSAVAEIKKKIVAITPEYKMVMANGKSGELKKKMALIKEEFNGKFDGQSLFIKGDIAAYSFEVELGGKVIGTVSKQLISWGDAYKIKAASEDVMDTLVTIVVAIDNACHNNND